MFSSAFLIFQLQPVYIIETKKNIITLPNIDMMMTVMVVDDDDGDNHWWIQGAQEACAPPPPGIPLFLLCIDMVLPMGWVYSPNFFCAVSNIIIDNANGYALDPVSTFVVNPPASGAYKTTNGATASPNCLQYVDVCMDDLICDSQVDPTQNRGSPSSPYSPSRRYSPPFRVR